MLGCSPLEGKNDTRLFIIWNIPPAVFQGKGAAGSNDTPKILQSQNHRTYYQVATPLYLKGKVLVMMTIQYLPPNCPIQVISMEPEEAAGEVSGRQVA